MGKCGCLLLGLECQGRKEAAAAGRGGRGGCQVEAATGQYTESIDLEVWKRNERWKDDLCEACSIYG